MSDKTRMPNVPEPSDPRFGEALREIIEVGEGLRGDPLDRKLTLRDVTEAGIAQLQSDGQIGPAESGGDEQDSAPDMDAPPPATNIAAQGVFSRVIITWNRPHYANHAMSEVARSTSSDFGQAEVVGSTTGRVYVDVTGGGFDGYWWVRHINQEGVKGQWNGPAQASTPKDPEYMLEQLTGNITSSPLYEQLQEEIGVKKLQEQWTVKVGKTQDGKTVVGGIGLAVNDPGAGDSATIDMGVIADRFWVANPNTDYTDDSRVFPFVIRNGTVYINEAHIAEASIKSAQIKSLGVEKLHADNATIDEALIEIANLFEAIVENFIASDNYKQNESGWIIRRSGSAEFNNIRMRGLIHNANLDQDGNPTSDSRYIDFREGVSNGEGGTTNGDFVLGNVEDNEYISFKYEQDAGKKILRVRGDILYKEFNPGNVPYFENTLNSTVGNIPNGTFADPFSSPWDITYYNTFRHDIEYLGASNGHVIDMLSYMSAIQTYFGIVPQQIFQGDEDPSIVKSTFVYGAGNIRVKSNGVCRPQQVFENNTDITNGGHLHFAYNIPVVALAIRKRSGSIHIIDVIMKYEERANNQDWTYHEKNSGKATNNYSWSIDRDVDVELGERIEILAMCFTHEEYIEYNYSASFQVRDFSDFFGGEVECNYMGLFVDEPYDTHAIK